MEREYTPRDRPLAVLEIANDIHKPSSNDSDSGAGENNGAGGQRGAYAEKTAAATTHHAWTLEGRLGSAATSAYVQPCEHAVGRVGVWGLFVVAESHHPIRQTIP